MFNLVLFQAVFQPQKPETGVVSMRMSQAREKSKFKTTKRFRVPTPAYPLKELQRATRRISNDKRCIINELKSSKKERASDFGHLK